MADIPYLQALESVPEKEMTLYHEMTESGVIDKTTMVFGQMNEPPGARMRVGLTGLTMAEYFRDKGGKDVLLFIDNIFRFTQAGSEVSALLRPYAFRCRLPADTADRDGCPAGANHFHKERFHYFCTGSLCTGGRLN